ncbi:mariner Mos1 transposase [Trichonephila clavipes]|nr:mariner Mos1 transposase [Trichonephila clavipes]
MFNVIESTTKCEVRTVIRFLTARNMSAADIHRQITEVYSIEAMSDSKVRKVRKFKDGRTNVHDEERSDPPSVITDYLMQTVETKIRENKIVFSVGTQTTRAAEHKEKTFASSLVFFIRYERKGDAILSRIITGDETWVSHITPESKQQSMKWRHTSSPVKIKAKQTQSKRKVMATVFWDRCSVLLVDFMPQGTTINSGAYCATLLKL